MIMTAAEKLSMKNFLNAFFRENHAEVHQDDDQAYIKYELHPFGFELRIPVTYHSLTGRHQYAYPAQLQAKQGEPSHEIHPWCLVGLLMQDLNARHPQAKSGHLEFMQRFFNSCENMQHILDQSNRVNVDLLFDHDVCFGDAENGLLAGHQMHPAAKSREGFTKHEFDLYSPELKNEFLLHYFLAEPEIIFTQSELSFDANELVRKYFLTESVNHDGIIIPLHPWQAKYIQTLPAIQRLMQQNKLKDLGQRGLAFSATTSVRTVYSQHSPFMAKLSLNVAITNSVRVQYKKELIRGIAAHQFWNSHIGREITNQYPQFSAVTDPAYLCIKEGDQVIDETAILFRLNPFTNHDNNTTPLATLCQDHPFETRNRFSKLIPLIAKNNQISQKQAALLWFDQFLSVAVEPLLWMFVHYGVAIEAHQQNLLLTLSDGLPVKSYYRDNQGYYIIDDAYVNLSNHVSEDILKHFCKGTNEFISHHFIYYLICNSVFGVINAIGTTGIIEEAGLIQALASFIATKHNHWQAANIIIPQLLEAETLPFKGNLLTRFYNLDELTAPLEQQSVYLEIDNLIKRAIQNQERI